MTGPSAPVAGTATTWKENRVLARSVDLLSARPLLFVLVVALAVRVFIAVVLTRYFSGTLVLDDTTYHFLAQQMAEGQAGTWDNFIHGLYWSTASFTVPVTFLYKVFGPLPIVGQLFAAVMGTFAAVFVTRLALEFLAPRWALVAGMIVALLPSQAFWSSMLMKDASVWFALTGLGAAVAAAAQATGKRLALLGVLAASLLLMLTYLRLHTLVVAVWALMIAAFFSGKQARAARITGALFLAIMIPWIFGAIGPAGVSLIMNHGSLEERRFENAQGAKTAIVPTGAQGVEVDDIEVAQLEQRATQLEQRATQLEQRATKVEDSDEVRAEELRREVRALNAKVEAVRAKIKAVEPPDNEAIPSVPAGGDGSLNPNLSHLPRGLSVMLLEPFPLPFEGSASLRLARLESLLWYPLLVFAAVGLWHARSHLRALLFPIMAGSGILIMYALSEGNIGTAHRHRGELVWIVALLAAFGMSKLVETRGRTSPNATLPSG